MAVFVGFDWDHGPVQSRELTLIWELCLTWKMRWKGGKDVLVPNPLLMCPLQALLHFVHVRVDLWPPSPSCLFEWAVSPLRCCSAVLAFNGSILFFQIQVLPLTLRCYLHLVVVVIQVPFALSYIHTSNFVSYDPLTPLWDVSVYFW